MPYVLKAWLFAEPIADDIYETREEAEADLEQLELMQPENIYEVEEITEEEAEEIRKRC